ncbi:hypothetical protein PAXINDRAFT_176558 [Paxillus involutus ATCC 200175]|uniref:Small COPII coat GTPase SAR1 n=1 Tax=Paxillus involutus ATCC 200175 TaxID=664439 RepID=A0A0C9SYN3_PAXIN|nr:hypothetical protein PAXINDRAFT_176558 [Paxillus involutus ATCC 200175]
MFMLMILRLAAFASSLIGQAYKEAHMLILGLDASGKTASSSVIDNVKFTVYEFSGLIFRGVHRPWRRYVKKIDDIVFLVDSSDIERFPKAKSELHTVLSSEEFAEVPVLVLGNKVDCPVAVNEEYLRYELGLGTTTGKGLMTSNVGVRPIEVFMCSVTGRCGMGEALRWLAQYM